MNFGAAIAASFRRETAFIRRSRADLILLFAMPLLAIVVLAGVFHGSVFADVPVAMVNADHSALGRAIERKLMAVHKLRVTTATTLSRAMDLLRAAHVDAVVYVPPGVEADAVRHQDNAVVIYFNAAFQSTATAGADAARAAVEAALSDAASRRGAGPSAPAARIQLPSVQVSTIGNPQASYEKFVEPLAAPLVLNVLLACALVFALGREVTDGTLAAWCRSCADRMLACVLGKIAPYVLVYWLWGTLWTLYMTGLRGWPIAGSLAWVLAMQFVYFFGTGSIAALLVGGLRDLDSALSMAAFYTASGLSFSGATLPVNGDTWFVKAWSAFLPSTSYLQIQSQQWILASPLASGARPFVILALFATVPLAVGVWRLRKLAETRWKPRPLYSPPTPAAFPGAFRQTLGMVARNKPILAVVVVAVVLYGFYYPPVYGAQTVIKTPVAVVDLDHSPLSRAFLHNLSATRAVDIVAQPDSMDAARRQLEEDQVSGVIAIPDGLEKSVIKGTPGGINAWLSGAYLVRARFIGEALGGAIRGSVNEVLAPLLATSRGRNGRVRTTLEPMYNQTNGYGSYVMPGVATVLVQATLLFGVAMFMGLKRSVGRWRMATRAFLGVWAAFIVLGSLTSWFWFGFVLWFQDLPRGGNLAGLLLCTPIFVAAVTAMGLVIGSLFHRHERAVQLLAGTSIPVFFLTGLSWPQYAIPSGIMAFANLIPSTTATRLFIDLNSAGASIGQVLPEVAVLLIVACLFGALAWLRLTPPEANQDSVARRARNQA